MMKDYSIRHLLERESEQKRKMKEKCEKIASNLHHLVSTKNIPGVFHPTLQDKKKILGEDVDSFLKKTFKQKFNTSIISKKLSLKNKISATTK